LGATDAAEHYADINGLDNANAALAGAQTSSGIIAQLRHQSTVPKVMRTRGIDVRGLAEIKVADIDAQHLRALHCGEYSL
jgi:hypothetical protein